MLQVWFVEYSLTQNIAGAKVRRGYVVAEDVEKAAAALTAQLPTGPPGPNLVLDHIDKIELLGEAVAVDTTVTP